MKKTSSSECANQKVYLEDYQVHKYVRGRRISVATAVSPPRRHKETPTWNKKSFELDRKYGNIL